VLEIAISYFPALSNVDGYPDAGGRFDSASCVCDHKKSLLTTRKTISASSSTWRPDEARSKKMNAALA
jgi:hypothetical protein